MVAGWGGRSVGVSSSAGLALCLAAEVGPAHHLQWHQQRQCATLGSMQNNHCSQSTSSLRLAGVLLRPEVPGLAQAHSPAPLGVCPKPPHLQHSRSTPRPPQYPHHPRLQHWRPYPRSLTCSTFGWLSASQTSRRSSTATASGMPLDRRQLGSAGTTGTGEENTRG